MAAVTQAVAPVKEDLTNQLLARFKDLIAQGVLQPGVKLPPERELAPTFGVSRSSLRHALKVMEAMGVVRQRVGDGTYLTDASSRILAEPLEFLMLLDGISAQELVEMRMIVEPELAARAAQRATSQDIDSLRRCLKIMADDNDLSNVVEADLQFHEAIFRASGNRMCARLFSVIHRSMASSMVVTNRMQKIEHLNRVHRPIFEAIDRRRPEDARRAMLEHLDDTRRLLLEATVQRPSPDLGGVIGPIRGSRKKKA